MDNQRDWQGDVCALLIPPATPSPVHSWASWRPSPAVIAVARCSIAYLLASLFTFVPALAKLLTTTYEEDAHGRISRKPAFSAHMVATIVVYVSDIFSCSYSRLLSFGRMQVSGDLTMPDEERLLIDPVPPSQIRRHDAPRRQILLPPRRLLYRHMSPLNGHCRVLRRLFAVAWQSLGLDQRGRRLDRVWALGGREYGIPGVGKGLGEQPELQCG